MSRRVLVLAAALALAGCGQGNEQVAGVVADQAAAVAPAAAPAPAASPSVADAHTFIAAAEQELGDFSLYAAKVAWVNATYLNEDTDWLNARALAERTALSVRLANEAARFDAVAGLSFDTRRKLDILKRMIVLPAPSTAGAAEELATLSTRLKSAYGKGRGTLGGEPKPGVELEALMGTERDPERLKEMWRSWHAVGAPMRRDYVRLVEIANAGARELGFSDLGAMWRSNYDMEPGEFALLTDTLWGEVKPLYDQLHCYTRRKLNEKYGDAVQPATRPDPRRPARQHVGAAVGRDLRHRRARRRGRHRLRPHRPAGEERLRRDARS